MCINISWLDGLYFSFWKQIIKKPESFEDSQMNNAFGFTELCTKYYMYGGQRRQIIRKNWLLRKCWFKI